MARDNIRNFCIIAHIFTKCLDLFCHSCDQWIFFR